MTRRILLPLASVLGPLVILGGCIFNPKDEHKPPPPVDDYKKATAPESVLANLEIAYTRKDASAYDSLLYDATTAIDTLNQESYSFWFAEEDIGGPTHIPANWGRDAEMSSARGLFSSSAVEDISMTLTFGPSFYDNTIGREGQKIINVTDVYLTVNRRETGGELTTFLVQGQKSDFRFKVQWVDAEGDSLWRIIWWKDWGSGAGFQQTPPPTLASIGERRARALAGAARGQVEAGAAVEPPRTRLLREALLVRKP